MATGKALSVYLENKFLDHLFGNTAYTAPGTIYFSLHLATTLSSGAASGQANISTPVHIPVGSTVVIDPLGTVETFTVLSISGAGPYTVTLSANLANTRLAGVYVKFDPADDGTDLLPPSGGSYARASLTNNTTNFPNASSGSKSTGAAITWPAATADWGLATHLTIYDALTTGNLLWYGAFTTPQLIQNGATFSIPTSNLTLILD